MDLPSIGVSYYSDNTDGSLCDRLLDSTDESSVPLLVIENSPDFYDHLG